MTHNPSRIPKVILAERAEHLAFLATERTYEREPELWEMGEHGRARTLEDFGHHFRALAQGPAAFSTHIRYCYDLFSKRGFPLRWLDDAWKTMHEVCHDELEGDVLVAALSTMELAKEPK